MSDWSEEAINYVQAIADTKLVLSQRYAERMLAGPSLEDNIAGASAAQDEAGQVRQLFRLLEQQGVDHDWLHDARSPDEYANAASLDNPATDWTNFIVQSALTDRAAWLLLDAIIEEGLEGMVQKMGEDEYFHLEHHDGRLETLAEDDPAALEDAFETYLSDVLAFIGPAEHDDDSDPLMEAEFTDRSAADIHEALIGHYEDLLADTPVDVPAVDAPSEDEWDAERRRVDDGTVEEQVVTELQGIRNKQFAPE
jgi:ring-1,2-phenylacetyl-CoA epoxidase subunit PaaC